MVKIYVDLDGVLSDFDQQLADITHEPLKRPMFEDSPSGDKGMWAIITKAGKDFWADMPWMQDGRALWEAIKQYKPIILTAPSRDQSSIEGKKEWLSRNLPDIPYIIDKNKDKYAAEGAVLIDDREKNIRKWREAGGVGILHKDTPTTLKEIDKAIKREHEEDMDKLSTDRPRKIRLLHPRHMMMLPGQPISDTDKSDKCKINIPTPKVDKDERTYDRRREKDVSQYLYAASKVRRAAEGLMQADNPGNPPDLILTVGIPGSGKSHWIKSQAGYVVVSPDDIRRELSGSISDQSKNAQVWPLAKQRVLKALNDRKNVILDATNVDAPYRKDFISGLPECTLKAKVFDVSPEIAKDRIRKDLEQGKDRSVVPDYVIDRMYANFKSTMDENQLESEGFQVI